MPRDESVLATLEHEVEFFKSRWVHLDGRTVRFGNAIGPFREKTHVHHFPSLWIAEAFCRELLKLDEEGEPSGLDPVVWAQWQEDYL